MVRTIRCWTCKGVCCVKKKKSRPRLRTMLRCNSPFLVSEHTTSFAAKLNPDLGGYDAWHLGRHPCCAVPKMFNLMPGRSNPTRGAQSTSRMHAELLSGNDKSTGHLHLNHHHLFRSSLPPILPLYPTSHHRRLLLLLLLSIHHRLDMAGGIV